MINTNFTQTTQYPASHPATRSVLLATDGSSYGEPALNNAIQMAKNGKCRLVITYFADPDDCALFDGFSCRNNEEWQAYGQRVLDRLAQRARDAGVQEVETILQHYQGEESLARIGRQVDAEVTVLASHLFIR